MRYAFAALILATAAVPASAAPSPQELMAAWQVANGNCRGGNPENLKTQAECDRRERLGGRLDQLDWCYGKQGEIGAEHRWHRCTAQSVRPQDLRESRF